MKVQSYKKKPVIVQAIQYTGLESYPAVCEFTGWLHRIVPDGIVITTLEGNMTASIGDYIIRGVKGEFYPCKPDIFAATYETIGEGFYLADSPVQPFMINPLVEAAYLNAVRKGWHDEPRSIGEMIALMHSELSEALEDHRNGHGVNETYYEGEKPCGIPVELADTVIRIFDFCGKYSIDLESAIREKMAYNSTRPHRHGGKVL